MESHVGGGSNSYFPIILRQIGTRPRTPPDAPGSPGRPRIRRRCPQLGARETRAHFPDDARSTRQTPSNYVPTYAITILIELQRCLITFHCIHSPNPRSTPSAIPLHPAPKTDLLAEILNRLFVYLRGLSRFVTWKIENRK